MADAGRDHHEAGVPGGAVRRAPHAGGADIRHTQRAQLG